MASDFSKSLIQMLRPLTTPATSRLPGSPPTAASSSRLAGRGTGEVQRQSVDGRLGQHRQRLAEPVEVRGDQQLRAVGERAEVAVGAGRGVQLGGGAVLHQRRFVQLHPVGAGRPQIGEHLGVDGQQPVEQGQRVEAGRDTGRGLGQQQVGDRPDEDRAGGEAETRGPPSARRPAWRSPRRRRCPGPTPGPGSGSWCRTTWSSPAAPRPACRGPSRSSRRAGRRLDRGAVAGGDRADHHAGVQDVVVVREVAGRHLVDAGLGELLPVAAAQLGGGARRASAPTRPFQ